jgi:hypothetical protein
MSNPFKAPEVSVVPDTSEEDAKKESKKRRKKIRESRDAFQARVATLGAIQLQAPTLGGI